MKHLFLTLLLAAITVAAQAQNALPATAHSFALGEKNARGIMEWTDWMECSIPTVLDLKNALVKIMTDDEILVYNIVEAEDSAFVDPDGTENLVLTLQDKDQAEVILMLRKDKKGNIQLNFDYGERVACYNVDIDTRVSGDQIIAGTKDAQHVTDYLITDIKKRMKSPNFAINLISLYADRTELLCDFHGTGREGNIRISPDTYLQIGKQQYKLISALGIAIAPEMTPFNDKEYTFTLIFPAIPEGTTSLDFIEPTEKSTWSAYGLKLRKKSK